VGHVACMEEIRYVSKILFGKIQRKRPRGRPKCRWKVYVKMKRYVILVGS
jgi:hypothetical protein